MPFLLELFPAPKSGAGPLALVVSIRPIITVLVASIAGADTVTWRRARGTGLRFIVVLPLVLQDAGDLMGLFGLGLFVGVAVPVIDALYHTVISWFGQEDLQSSEVVLEETLAGTLLTEPTH